MSLNLSDELASLATTSLARTVCQGDIWQLVPNGTLAHVYEDSKKRTKVDSGIVDGGVYRSVRGKIASTEFLKIIDRPTDRLHPRSGVLLGNTLRWGQAVVAPGFGGDTRKPGGKLYFRDLPRAIVTFEDPIARAAIQRDWIRYELWNMWHVDPTPGRELLAYRTHVSVGNVDDAPELDALDYCRLLLAEALGLLDDHDPRPRKWLSVPDLKYWRPYARYKRGELVAVAFSADKPRVRCLVVSDDALSGLDATRLIVIPTHSYDISHDDKLTLVPLTSPDDLVGIGAPCSLDLTLIRGINAAPPIVVPFSPRTYLPRHLFNEEVLPTMKVLYGDP